jgi:hypothetical protein
MFKVRFLACLEKKCPQVSLLCEARTYKFEEKKGQSILVQEKCKTKIDKYIALEQINFLKG